MLFKNEAKNLIALLRLYDTVCRKIHLLLRWMFFYVPPLEVDMQKSLRKKWFDSFTLCSRVNQRETGFHIFLKLDHTYIYTHEDMLKRTPGQTQYKK